MARLSVCLMRSLDAVDIAQSPSPNAVARNKFNSILLRPLSALMRTSDAYNFRLPTRLPYQPQRPAQVVAMCRVREEFTAGFCRFCNVKSAMRDDVLQCYDSTMYRPFYDKGLVRDPTVSCDFPDRILSDDEYMPPALPTFTVIPGNLPWPCIRCRGEGWWAQFLEDQQVDFDLQFQHYLDDIPAAYQDLEGEDWHGRPYVNEDVLEDLWPEDNEGYTYQGPLPEWQDDMIMLNQHIDRAGGAEYVDDEINERLAQWDINPELLTIDDCFYQRPWNSEPVLAMDRVAAHRRWLAEEAWNAAHPIPDEMMDFIDEADRLYSNPDRHRRPWE